MPENHEGWEDSSVPPDKLGAYLRDLKKLMDKYDYVGPLYGHFGQGCVHTRLTFDLRDRRRASTNGASFSRRRPTWWSATAARFRANTATDRRAASCCARMYSPEIIEAFREFKSIWDPDWKMNPGQGGRSVSRRRESARGHELQPAPGEDAFPFSGRPSQLRLCDAIAASARVSAAVTRAATEPCVPATW